jgi:hypothetical protein
MRVRERRSQFLYIAAACALTFSSLLAQQQVNDPAFDPVVAMPAYLHDGPTVLIDEAHRNFHTAGDRYQTFADLLRADGYIVRPNTKTFDDATPLADARVLVIANAGMPVGNDLSIPAFTDRECDVLHEWVSGGGSILLVSDHAPYGHANASLARRFGVEMGQGWVFVRAPKGGITTQLSFSRDAGQIGAHPITTGRNPSESVSHIVAFTGQSLSVPDGAVALMKLSPDARESPTPAELDASDALVRHPSETADSLDAHSTPDAGRAQGIAMTVGKGRLVVLGEAAMLSAQVVVFDTDGHRREMKIGMNVPGNDDRQFALNVLHWLSGILN